MMHLYTCEDFANLMACTVLILVVMDDALVPIVGVLKDKRAMGVLILVVMDDALVH